MIQSLIKKIIEHKTLSEKEAEQVMEGLINEEISEFQASSLLSVMRYRGETAEEISGFVRVIRKYSKVPEDRIPEAILDTCGTGGDGSSTFNISTAVSLILASLGIKVAKHGNKAITSKSGSSDVLEVLGIRAASDRYEAMQQLHEYDIAFLHAPAFHPALKKVASIRQQLPFRTIFNIVGPLCNPISPSYQLIGVSDVNTARTMAKALTMLGIKKALLVSGNDGLDECSISSETSMLLVEEGVIRSFSYAPEDAGLERGSLSDITVKNKHESAQLIRDILKGSGNKSAKNIVILNAAAALFASNHVSSIKDGVLIIKRCLEEGTAYRHLQGMTREEGKALVN
jgi:anthranilate phosphoribosyltransferase